MNAWPTSENAQNANFAFTVFYEVHDFGAREKEGRRSDARPSYGITSLALVRRARYSYSVHRSLEKEQIFDRGETQANSISGKLGEIEGH
jgi:hypothetical protein